MESEASIIQQVEERLEDPERRQQSGRCQLSTDQEGQQDNGEKMVVLDPFLPETRRKLSFVLQQMKEIQRRRKPGVQGVKQGAEAAVSAAHSDVAGGSQGFRSQADWSGSGNEDLFTCEQCGRTGLEEDTASNRPGHILRPDFLWRARRPNHAVTCSVCGPDAFVVCGECFNTHAHRHPPDHQLVLWADAKRLAEKGAWPSRNWGRKPLPPGPGRGGKPRRGPWG